MINSLLNLFYPKVCVGCNSFLINGEHVICTSCRHEIPLTNHSLNPENEAFKKFYGKIPVEFVGAFVYFHKKGIVQEMVHHLKYKGHQEVGTILGLWYAEELKKIQCLKSVDEIIPVPLHKIKLKRRGYNQVSTFGKALSEQLDIPFNEKLLSRTTNSKTQTAKGLLKRTELGDQNIFDVVSNELLHNKHYLLIDDVLTTGSTLESCSRALLKVPGARISVVCMAMSHS